MKPAWLSGVRIRGHHLRKQMNRYTALLLFWSLLRRASHVLLYRSEATVERIRRHDRRGTGDLIVPGCGGRRIRHGRSQRRAGGGLFGVRLWRRGLRRRCLGTGRGWLGLDHLRLRRRRARGSLSRAADTDLAGEVGEESIILSRR